MSDILNLSVISEKLYVISYLYFYYTYMLLHFMKKLTLKCIVSGFRIKLVSYSDLQFYFFKVLRNFDGMISQAVTDNLEHGGVEVCRKTQVKTGLTWGLGG